jgi:hypothetical protein
VGYYEFVWGVCNGNSTSDTSGERLGAELERHMVIISKTHPEGNGI